jgi:hypothetical protein
MKLTLILICLEFISLVRLKEPSARIKYVTYEYNPSRYELRITKETKETIIGYFTNVNVQYTESGITIDIVRNNMILDKTVFLKEDNVLKEVVKFIVYLKNKEIAYTEQVGVLTFTGFMTHTLTIGVSTTFACSSQNKLEHPWPKQLRVDDLNFNCINKGCAEELLHLTVLCGMKKQKKL